MIKGQIDGIGTRPRLAAFASDKSPLIDQTYQADKVPDVPAAIAVVAAWLRETQSVNLVAVGHRVVHGGPDYSRPVAIDQTVLTNLERYVSLAPLHQPNNLAPIRTLLKVRPDLLQVACFDTAFHRGHDAVADYFAIPANFYTEGVRRYGFHGLSYEYVAERLRDVLPTAATGRVIVAHLGSGASMCALANGRSVESTMGFTALDGIPMGTRPGQIDPGVVLYLITERGMSAAAVQDMLYRESGLKGLSGISNDMRDLETNVRSCRRACRRLFRLSRRAARRNAGGGPWRTRCLRVHRRDWRELGNDSPPYRREACMARRRFRQRCQCRAKIRDFTAGKARSHGVRSANGRGINDCAAYACANS